MDQESPYSHAAQFYDYSSNVDHFHLKADSIEQFSGTHDLIGLGPWGPYGKRYFGLSYLPGPSLSLIHI